MLSSACTQVSWKEGSGLLFLCYFISFSVAVKKGRKNANIKRTPFFLILFVPLMISNQKRISQMSFSRTFWTSHFFCIPSRQKIRSKDTSDDDNMDRSRPIYLM